MATRNHGQERNPRERSHEVTMLAYNVIWSMSCPGRMHIMVMGRIVDATKLVSSTMLFETYVTIDSTFVIT